VVCSQSTALAGVIHDLSRRSLAIDTSSGSPTSPGMSLVSTTRVRITVSVS
jgi:hypothetical protein